MAKYAIGLDFGTLSCRGVMADVSNGEQLAESVFEYPHGVMSERMPDGVELPAGWALAHPQDYLDALDYTVRNIVKESRVPKNNIIGIGIDTTGCSPLPVKADGTPLCFLEKFKNEPHAYIKLWKHHAAQPYADKLNQTASERNEKWLQRYGGKISSEWYFPKIWQILEEAPEVYSAMDLFIELNDWLVWQLTGRPVKNACYAGYKAIWNKNEGYPSKEFFAALDQRLENVIEEKSGLPIFTQGKKAGTLTKTAAERLGLQEGIAVAVGNSDALVNVPAAKISTEGKMLAVMGTSSCHLLLGREERNVPGICGCVQDGILPGFFGYEAGQSCVGDHFDWFVRNCVPEEYMHKAREMDMDIHQYLQHLASELRPGQSGLLALDWWNGNRSVLADANLTGLMIGMTLSTKCEEMYRALIEATAFGARIIIENYETHGIAVNEFIAMGGISQKSPFILQIYADVLNRKIYVAGSRQGPAVASAMFGALAAGKENGGWSDITEAAEAMGKLDDKVYVPEPENAEVYNMLYAEYKTLHDLFGRTDRGFMRNLKYIKKMQTDKQRQQ